MTNINKILLTTFYLFSVFSFFSCNRTSGSTSNCDCELFKNGNFIYKSDGMTFLINRQDSIQIETDPNTGFTSKIQIKWTDKCNYEGLCIESTFPFSDSIQNVRKTIPIKVQIISTGKNYYVFEAKRDKSPILTDTMWLDNTK
jgi:hypothetical protein